MKCFWLVASVSISWLLGCAALAAPTGRIAFIRGDAAYVLNIATASRVKLPLSSRTEELLIAPRGGAVVYFVRSRGVAAGEVQSYYAFISRPPYRSAHLLPAPLDRVARYTQATWTADGSRVRLALRPDAPEFGVWRNGVVFEYQANSQRIRRLEVTPPVTSRNGRYEVYQTSKAILVRDRRTGQSRVVFSQNNPERLLKALNGVADQGAISTDGNWWLSELSISGDGQEISFVSDLGSGSSAAGGNSYFIGAFSVRVASRAVRVISSCTGCKVPVLERSPDGKKLLFAYASHASAADNSWTGEVIDLKSGRKREVIFNTKEAAPIGAANLTWGWSWSPDSRYIALAVNYYDPFNYDVTESRLRSDFNVYVRRASDGAAVRVIPQARDPSWGAL